MSLVHRKRGFRKSTTRPRNSNSNHHPTAFKRPDTVHLNNLPFDIEEEEVLRLLEFFGPIEDILVHKLRMQQKVDGKEPFTFAFVNFRYSEDAARCIGSSVPIIVRGRQVTFNTRKPPQKKDELQIPKITLASDTNGTQANAPCPTHSFELERNFLPQDPWSLNSYNWTERYKTTQPLQNLSHVPTTLPMDPSRPDSCASAATSSSLESSFSLIVNVNSNRPDTADSFIDGSKSIILADRIPSHWSSEELYHRLEKWVPNVTSVLLYKDYDERGFVQGLIQLQSPQLCNLLCAQGVLMIEGAQLELMQSEVKSIGQLKRRYSGNYSIFEPRSADRSADPTELETLTEPAPAPATDHSEDLGTGQDKDYWEHEASSIIPGREITDETCAELQCPDSESPMSAQDFTPATDFTPSTDIYCDEKLTFTETQIKQAALKTVKPTEFSTFVRTSIDPPNSAHSPKNRIRTYNKAANPDERMQKAWSGITTMAPMGHIMPMVASSTIIVDNLESKVKENLQSQLERLSANIGAGASVNIANIGHRYRAFICFENPNQAHASLSLFMRHYEDSPVQVRFA